VTPRDVARKTEGQDGVAVSFLVGLFHSLQHAGLSRRTLINAAVTGQIWRLIHGGEGSQAQQDLAARKSNCPRLCESPSIPLGENNSLHKGMHSFGLARHTPLKASLQSVPEFPKCLGIASADAGERGCQ
jgi:hypothetical protein